jgi:hypothetical protein
MGIDESCGELGKFGLQGRWEPCLDESEERIHCRARSSVERPVVLWSIHFNFMVSALGIGKRTT